MNEVENQATMKGKAVTATPAKSRDPSLACEAFPTPTNTKKTG
jgi:hypothetical protein